MNDPSAAKPAVPARSRRYGAPLVVLLARLARRFLSLPSLARMRSKPRLRALGKFFRHTRRGAHTAVRPEVCGLVPGLVSVVLTAPSGQLEGARETIACLLAQTYQDIELIVASEDGEAAVRQALLPYLDHPRLRIFALGGRSCAASLPEVLAHARGEYWVELSSGDVLATQMIATLVGGLKSDPALGMLYSHEAGGACFMYRGWIGRLIRLDPHRILQDPDYRASAEAFFPIRHLERYNVLEQAQRVVARGIVRANPPLQSVQYLADASGYKWLRRHDVARDHVRLLHQAEKLPEAGYDVLMVGIAGLARDPERFRACNRPLAVILDHGRADYVKVHDVLSSQAVVLAYDQASAMRIRLVSRCPILDGGSVQALTAVQAYARLPLLREPARSPAWRFLPPLLPPAHPNILLQVDDFTEGGLENVVIDLGVSLKALGYGASLAILGREGAAAGAARRAGLDVHSFGAPPEPRTYEEFLRRQKVDLVNGHYSIHGAQLCARLGIPFVQTIHNAYVWMGPHDADRYAKADSGTASYVCVSASAARYADIKLGLNVSKMRVIPNGVDPERIIQASERADSVDLRGQWGVAPDAPVFLNVASIMRPKAQLLLVRAFAEVLAEAPHARLVLLGRNAEPAYMAEIEDAIQELGIGRSVVIAGYQGDVAAYYRAADYFVLPSFWEGWSLSLGEAVANGLPCVITDVGSAYEFRGCPSIEIVRPPYGDIAALDSGNLNHVLTRPDAAFERRLGQALLRTMARKKTGGIDSAFLERADRLVAYRSYALHFADILAKARADRPV